MFKLIFQIFPLLTSQQKKRFYYLQLLVFIMAIMEIVGVASIFPFMTLIGDISQLKKNQILAHFYHITGFASERDFLILLGTLVLLMLFISALTSVFTIWRISMFANNVGVEISARLYNHYLKQNWLFHSSNSSPQLTNKIAIESERVTAGIIMPIMQINSGIVLAFLMSLTIVIYDPIVAFIGLFIFAVAYFVFYKLVRMYLQRLGLIITNMYEQRFQLMNEGFGGIKDILLLGRDENFIKLFRQTGKKMAYSRGSSAALSLVPRYLMELIAFGTMITLLLYLIFVHNGNLGVVLPKIALFALAGVKLLPAFQKIYSHLALIKANTSAFESIKKDLTDSNYAKISKLKLQNKFLYPKQKLYLKNITFTYPDNVQPTIKHLNLSVNANSLVGIVGPSGGGKSTLIDIILGLIVPQHGHLKIDDIIISDKNRRSWQNTIGLVSQNVFLSEGTIAENIAFGVPKEKIDMKQVRKVLGLAQLDELIKTLKKGIHTKVGERGVKLSGGQCQRVGIARALYNNAKVLVFDEATSSLDGITEKKIMDSIDKLSGKKTIFLIAHRLKTVKNCNIIFFINNGKIVDYGTYQKLIDTNEDFKKLAKNA